ncbi:MAG: peptidylprolyl isomerase [Puniceicoccales bacterium]|jgi:hypothetical protein|nr:peptidylprolyl isomerase [Puniceicoccales bacterium]
MRIISLLGILVLPAALSAQTGLQSPPARPLSLPSPTAPRQLSPTEELSIQWTNENRNQPRASVDSSLITLVEVRSAVAPALVAHRREAKNQAEFNMRRDSAMMETVQYMVDNEKLCLAEFRERGAPVPRAMVSRQVADKIQRLFHGDKNEYLNMLERMGITPLEDRRQIEEGMIANYVREEIFKSYNEVSPRKIAEHYKASQKEKYTRTEQVRYRHIFLTPGAAETEAEVRALAQNIIEDARKGISFEELAKRHSRDNNSDMDTWRETSDLNERTITALKALPDNGISDALEFTPPGGRVSLYIFQKTGYREGGPIPIEEVQDAIAAEISNKEKRAALEEWQQSARKKYFVRFY